MRYTSFPSSFFTNNRTALLNKLPGSSLALLFSGSAAVRNADQYYPFRVDSNFFYFTGLTAPNLALLLVKTDIDTKVFLFIPDVNPKKEMWEGKQLTTIQAQELSGIKQVISDSLLLPTLFREQNLLDSLYIITNETFVDAPLTKEYAFYQDIRHRLPGLAQKKLAPLCAELRFLKQKEESEAITKAIDITHIALSRLCSTMKPGIYEYELEAELIYTYLKYGCDRVGFDPIVASGKNATVLHYVTNDSLLCENELLLVDTGGEKGMYTSDITRVFPINGKFTERQRHCYQAVLEVNKRFITVLKVGYTWKELQKIASDILGEVYQKYGFISSVEEHKTISLHSIGHALGLDVHDQGQQRYTNMPLQEGAIITVEPGLYLPEEGIGIRIEDNVLLTKDKAIVLSAAIPKEVDEVEQWIAQVRK